MLGATVRFHRRGTIPKLVEALAENVHANQTVRIVDLLRAIPEMDDILRDTLNEGMSAVAVTVHPDVLALRAGHQLTLKMEPALVNELPIATALKDRGAKLAPVEGRTLMWASEYDIEDERGTLLIRTPQGYVAEMRLDGSYIPELAVYVSVLYALSEFTRYYPRDWLDVYAEHGADLALIREFMPLAERKGRELALSELSETRMTFRHA